jgi:pyruvate/2-oxoglutarate dehydrogenase complex dihydrolipoamide acyltransferase (E2) component
MARDSSSRLKSARGLAMLASMSTSEEPGPLAAAEPSAAPESVELEAASGAAPPAEHGDPHTALSPAVRRLVRQFDLDITGVHGTGPAGRIRVGDIMNLLDGRTDSGSRSAAFSGTFVAATNDDAASPEPEPGTGPVVAPATPASAATPTTTVFDCDLSPVLAHRKKLRQNDVDLTLTSYFVAALGDAFGAVPEVGPKVTSLGLRLTTTDGATRTAFVDLANVAGTHEERVRAADAAIKRGLDADLANAPLLVHHYGESGSLLATPTPFGVDHAASIGIGRVRREIVLRNVDGVEQPRVAARCYVSLSFLADRIAFDRANRFVAHAVRVLEQWPD